MNLICPKTSKDANKVLTALLIAEFTLGMIFLTDFLLGSPSWWFHALFDLDNESNIPTWFSTIQLFMIGYTFLFIGCHSNHQPPPSKLGTCIFSLGFFYLSMDEAAVIHEKLTWVFFNNPWVPYFHGRHGVWIVVYGCLAILFIILLYRDLWAFWKAYRTESEYFLSGILIFLVGAAAMETLTFFFLDVSNQLHYTCEVILEELLEMSGASLMLYSVLLIAAKKSQQAAKLQK